MTGRPGFIFYFFVAIVVSLPGCGDSATMNPACLCSQLSLCSSYNMRYISPKAETATPGHVGMEAKPKLLLVIQDVLMPLSAANLLLPGKA